MRRSTATALALDLRVVDRLDQQVAVDVNGLTGR
jgi:hypothetical protein